MCVTQGWLGARCFSACVTRSVTECVTVECVSVLQEDARCEGFGCVDRSVPVASLCVRLAGHPSPPGVLVFVLFCTRICALFYLCLCSFVRAFVPFTFVPVCACPCALFYSCFWLFLSNFIWTYENNFVHHVANDLSSLASGFWMINPKMRR